jgi:hypothetical protein
VGIFSIFFTNNLCVLVCWVCLGVFGCGVSTGLPKCGLSDLSRKVSWCIGCGVLGVLVCWVRCVGCGRCVGCVWCVVGVFWGFPKIT